MKINRNEMKKLILFFIILMTNQLLVAQSINVPMGNQSYHFVDRLEIKSGKFAPFHTTHKYYQRGELAQWALSLDTLNELAWSDALDLKYIYNDNNQYLGETPYSSNEHSKYEKTSKPFLKYFLKSPARFYEYAKKDFSVTYDPIISIAGGQESTETAKSGYFHRNYGAQISGEINDRVHFYSNILMNFDRHQPQTRRYREEHLSIPGQGYYKGPYTFAGVDSIYDNISAQGYIDFKVTESINFQFGHGRNFIGNGMRSLLLSDFADNYLYLKMNTKVGIFDYQNLFAEMRQLSTSQTATGELVKKYYAAHHLSLNLSDQLNIGIFESLIINRQNGFELNYLNPIIFYRSVERSLDSPDNAMIGLDFKWNVAKRFQFYGQMVIDELYASRVLSEPGLWTHKFGNQLGIKYIDAFGIDHLDLQFEYNGVRPYTYSHVDSSTSYSHFSQPLAHPLGANFREFIGIVRYQPTPKLILKLQMMQAQTGLDTLGSNWGSDIFASYYTRENSDNVKVGQGVETDIFLLDFQASYMLLHNMYADLKFQYRTQNSEFDGHDYNHTFVSLGFRYNFWSKPAIY